MKRIVFSFVVVAAIAISAVVVTSCGNAQAQGGGNVKVERWEYKVSTIRESGSGWEDKLSISLNSFGAEGWELIYWSYERDACIFKRRVP